MKSAAMRATSASKPHRPRARLSGIAEQLLDARHRRQQLLLLRLGQRAEQDAHIALRARVDRCECPLARGREAEVLVPRVVGRAGALNQAAFLETAQQAAQVAGVEIEFAREFGGGKPIAVGQLPQQPRFGERELRRQQAFVQRADVARVETIEAADRFDAGGGRGRHGADFSADS